MNGYFSRPTLASDEEEPIENINLEDAKILSLTQNNIEHCSVDDATALLNEAEQNGEMSDVEEPGKNETQTQD